MNRDKQKCQEREKKEGGEHEEPADGRTMQVPRERQSRFLGAVGEEERREERCREAKEQKR